MTPTAQRWRAWDMLLAIAMRIAALVYITAASIFALSHEFDRASYYAASACFCLLCAGEMRRIVDEGRRDTP